MLAKLPLLERLIVFMLVTPLVLLAVILLVVGWFVEIFEGTFDAR